MTALPEALYGRFSRDRTQDALGSVRMITDASGAVVARIEYGAYGEEIFVSAIPALANFPYRFVGALGCRTDAAMGLVYMRNRWYDCTLQRFISRDPIGLAGGENLFTYVDNNPINIVDPFGLQPLTSPVQLPPPPVQAPVRQPVVIPPLPGPGYGSGRVETTPVGRQGIPSYRPGPALSPADPLTEAILRGISEPGFQNWNRQREGRLEFKMLPKAAGGATGPSKWDSWKRTGSQVWEQLEKHRDAPDEECNRSCRLKFLFARHWPGAGTKACVYTNNGHVFTYEQYPAMPCYPINYQTCMVDRDYFGPNPLQH